MACSPGPGAVGPGDAHGAVDSARPQATGRRGASETERDRAMRANAPRSREPTVLTAPSGPHHASRHGAHNGQRSEQWASPTSAQLDRALAVWAWGGTVRGRGRPSKPPAYLFPALSRPKEAKKRAPQTHPPGPTNGATTLTLLLLLPRARREQDTGYIRAPTHPRGQRARCHGQGGRRRRPVGRGHHQPQRVAPAALLRGRHLHRAQPQHPPPAPRGLRRRRLPVPPGRGLLPQCGRLPVRLLLLRRGLLPAHRAPRRRPRPPRARARDVLRSRRRRLARAPRRRRPRARGPAQEAHDQEPRVGVPLPRAQAGPRHPDRVGGAPAARGERAAPSQVRPAQGFGGGVGAGAEDAAEGALGALLIFLPEGGIEIEAAAPAAPTTTGATTTHIALEEYYHHYYDDRPCKSIRILLCFPFP